MFLLYEEIFVVSLILFVYYLYDTPQSLCGGSSVSDSTIGVES